MPTPFPTEPRTIALYDFLAWGYDWLANWEVKARRIAWQQLQLEPGHTVLNVGCGPGGELRRLSSAIEPPGKIIGVDLSWRMALNAGQRLDTIVCQADGGALPFTAGTFDALYCAYTLDLVAREVIPSWLAGFRRVLRPGGRLVTLSLTEGVDRLSRAMVRLWKSFYRLSPLICGGCYPLELAQWVAQAGFVKVQRLTCVDWGFPSEIIFAQVPVPEEGV